ncbi:undecaprenyl-diphosphate phosphatase [Vagococcus fluvialis]|uniref:Undecaprenyl-diphosphatase n=1 Tax=Vagococcus fluvialis TaxID=2738 RepID=A0A369B2R6_9ENTE|nr:undecaprenyl-diphosphate phosphatase [Vagococcus fluvialis]MBO0444428.1 undecaprenyl-diphosphate phosphatase [Vagococcus fluvialis]MBO0480221.1 undecaprenyl-diphosphate phosphatase [Vagococcus fluvialis]MBO0484996.1 undecaprenyl-diphosphate phosphatase [Vagococcus fluvialis]MCM2139211.1 undecaprenyl-diphosphate phosphatase [Vagococcus fluvialis]MDT2747451.1 undecaprenyl-diphosphate phosphatase [Vagococcus fluvialis]
MDFLNMLKVIFLGIVEGITEWLPISSTGHLILVDEFIKLDASPAFMEMFNVVIQLGAILAVVVLYFSKLNPFSSTKTAGQKKATWTLWFKVAAASVPAALIGPFIDDFLEEHFHSFLPVALMLIIYGILFIVIENRNKDKEPTTLTLGSLSYQTAIIIGLFQVLAMVPGTSRSGATIIGAIIFGCSRYVAAEFTFFLGIPVMFGASGLKILKFLKNGNSFDLTQTAMLLVGCIVAFVVSIIVIKFLMNYIKKNDFKAFGWYRIILGSTIIAYWLIFK